MNSAISVIVPCFNAERTIWQSLASVTAQTVQPYEVIVVDDGSMDGTSDVVEALSRLLPYIKLITQEKRGPSSARNAGVTIATGDVIAFLDSDDTWSADHLERHLEHFGRNKQLGVSFSRAAYVTIDGLPTGDTSRAFAGAVRPVDLLYSNPTATCSTLVFLKSVWHEAGPMNESQSFAEDQEWLFRAASTKWQVEGVNAVTVDYRVSGTGLSSMTTKMMSGWEAFLRTAAAREPQLVERHVVYARARMELYCCAHSWRSGGGALPVLRHLSSAMCASPAATVRFIAKWLASHSNAKRRNNRQIDSMGAR
jgi:glycosyltransferase involved in cell wall biosynthesis